jgi:predicted nucleic acid-binding protein
MMVVADAGPLIALAKVDRLPLLTALYQQIVTGPTVLTETVTAGLAMNAADAIILEQAYSEGVLSVRYPASGSLPQSGLLHAGEAESILLAIELNADWLLVDDLDARRLARQNIEKVNLKIGVKGTLGVIVTAAQAGLITTAQGIESIQAMENHPDIWLAPALCEVVVKILKRLSSE